MNRTVIEHAAQLIRDGQIVAFPTETVYGLGADATNESAIKKIYEAKGRPASNPLIVHLAANSDVEKWVSVPRLSRINQQYLKLEKFLPGPLTIVFPNKNKLISDLVTAGKKSVGIRMPAHSIAQEFLKACNLPIAAPSANRSNYVSATSAKHARDCFGEDLFIIDGGESLIGIESTIIALSETEPAKLFRYGAISKEELAETLGDDVIDCVPLKNIDKPESPGQFLKHYSPKTRLAIFNTLNDLDPNLKIGIITFSKESNSYNHNAITKLVSLTDDGDLNEAAHNLYSTLRAMDELDLDLILIEEPPKSGIGQAIIDRITRASQK